MAWFTPSERDFLRSVSQLVYCNPFLPRRVELEREALGGEFQEEGSVWSLQVEDPERPRANAWRISVRLEPIIETLRGRLLEAGAARAGEEERGLWEDSVLYLLYYRYTPDFLRQAFREPSAQPDWSFFREFWEDWLRLLGPFGKAAGDRGEAAHAFAIYYQIHRAFFHIYDRIIGSSLPSARLRAAVWESIFSHDMKRYRRSLYGRMRESTTLITGPSGTGKELVAQAIAYSAYLPFSPRTRSFEAEGGPFFVPVNLAALSPTLIESELFGHRKGSFTGALGDRRGWLGICPARGTVFLDEIGDLDPELQVKLLRVIESRSFQPVGATTDERFEGKLIAATNRDLARAVDTGAFRQDLYFRLCSDRISTPSLAEQMAASPGVLPELVLFMARRVVGAPEAQPLAEESLAWISLHLEDYSWPGNFRELEQCVRSILLHREYHPLHPVGRGSDSGFLARLEAGRATADELLSEYCWRVYSRCGSYVESARRLGLDRRTVKARVEAARERHSVRRTRDGESEAVR